MRRALQVSLGRCHPRPRAVVAIAGFVLWRRRAARKAALASDPLEAKQDTLFKPPPAYSGGFGQPSVTDTFLPPGGPPGRLGAGAGAAPAEVYHPALAAVQLPAGTAPEPGFAAPPLAAAVVSGSMVLAGNASTSPAAQSPLASQAPLVGVVVEGAPAPAWSQGASSPATSVPRSTDRADHAIIGRQAACVAYAAFTGCHCWGHSCCSAPRHLPAHLPCHAGPCHPLQRSDLLSGAPQHKPGQQRPPAQLRALPAQVWGLVQSTNLPERRLECGATVPERAVEHTL